MSEILLASEKQKSKDPRRAYGEVIEIMTKTMRRFRDLKIHVIFVLKKTRYVMSKLVCLLISL
jgi:hypothetical protein